MTTLMSEQESYRGEQDSDLTGQCERSFSGDTREGSHPVSSVDENLLIKIWSGSWLFLLDTRSRSHTLFYLFPPPNARKGCCTRPEAPCPDIYTRSA
ncbi:uncharacterized protein L969DRAFT_50818 [Mixia osmundae IAM 14324]|uniref:Uncharacterized protein n=1 Tax=Mixia osmundae (strain CBS 9802 / IAM 14324 / JCM 22182 / KY 12970) TaxID=764103 RepID=G7E0H7_MIXOS|nr:uncharacterized protein L969DRAFT_50818 [Mixia osmundae IAM 14324]KEI38346.1 hypothetical protein L969DRAFT_50818 [Mixia osmundae IAM 14324]GAA96337.1 hypothetical protein E5Q_03003 [Mixia osmundae IAM 14324]